MIPPLERDLAPLLARVESAQTALDAANRADDSPLGCLAPAGRLIHAQQHLVARMLDLLGAIGGDPETVEMQIQGRLNTLGS